jgi:hypothetical protein
MGSVGFLRRGYLDFDVEKWYTTYNSKSKIETASGGGELF